MRSSRIKMTKSKLLPLAILLGITLSSGHSHAQVRDSVVVNLYTIVFYEGDTIPYIKLREVVKYGKRRFKSRSEMNQYYKMIRNLKLTYPYAQLAKYKLLEMNEDLKMIKTERERREYINQAEKELRMQYEKDLRKFTVSQGKMLMKLIDRETGATSYDLVKELKGGFSATFWQGVARLFGSNLKVKFDPEGEDKLLNELIGLYEKGLL
ncbi:MAG TPA: DUF4294 domain-containing protein [Tenuifilaceae bacterium]|nr:DUF4294 domain-containing protein [Tenuifilaceae bacterium]